MRETVKHPIVSLELTAGLSDREKKRLSEFLASNIEESGKIRLLLFLKGYPARDTAESLFEDINFVRVHADDIEKMAVVRERAWQDTWVGVFGLFGRMETAYFDYSEKEKATNWLGQ
jgi:hypothetical protein